MVHLYFSSNVYHSSECQWLIEWVKVLRPTQHKIGRLETFPKPISWLGMEKQNLTQQKHTFTNQNKYTPTQHKHKTTKARFSHLLTHSTWKRRGLILILALHKFVTYFLWHPLFCSPRPTWDRVSSGLFNHTEKEPRYSLIQQWQWSKNIHLHYNRQHCNNDDCLEDKREN